MKLSVRTEYALRALVVLGLNHGQAVMRIQTISEQQSIPKRYLEQILNDLKSGGLLESKRGVAGGYRLKVPPDRITLAAVIRSIEGSIAPVRCVGEETASDCSCPDPARCGVRSLMEEVRDNLIKVLEGVTLAEFCERTRQLQAGESNQPDYVI